MEERRDMEGRKGEKENDGRKEGRRETEDESAGIMKMGEGSRWREHGKLRQGRRQREGGR